LDTFNKALDLFQTRGYSEVDTARIYVGGKQEAFTKEARWKERGLTLATKVQYPFASGDNTADKVIASVETSLKELGTDCVDVSVFWYLMLQMVHFLKARKKLTIMGALPDPISTQA
jgi:aflatoxin B1 aldehyde reductase